MEVKLRVTSKLSRARIALVIASTFVILGVIVLWLVADSFCLDFPPLSDSSTLMSTEARALLARAKNEYSEQSGTDSLPLAEPITVHIDGRTAYMTVAAPMFAGDKQYAQIWQGIFQTYHRGRGMCVRMELRWKSGKVSQRCCTPDI